MDIGKGGPYTMVVAALKLEKLCPSSIPPEVVREVALVRVQWPWQRCLRSGARTLSTSRGAWQQYSRVVHSGWGECDTELLLCYQRLSYKT